MNARRFLRLMTASAVGFALMGALLNIIVDPYALWNSSRIGSISAVKPQLLTRARVAKPMMVLRENPKTVLVGNSRLEMGIDPSDTCWPESAKPVFSLTIPGAGVEYQLRLAMHAVRGTRVRHILLGADFSDFLILNGHRTSSSTTPRWVEESKRLLDINSQRHNSKRALVIMKDMVSATFSLYALKDSLITVYKQRSKYPDDIDRFGFYNAGSFHASTGPGGWDALYEQKMPQIEGIFPPGRYFAVSERTGMSSKLVLLESFTEAVRDLGVQLTIVINPLHGELLNTVYKNGYWEQFEAWKIALTKIAESGDAILWDFANYNSLSTNYELTDTTPAVPKWYWEPSHYTANLGSRMLEEMFGK